MGSKFFGRVLTALAIAVMVALFFVAKGWAAATNHQEQFNIRLTRIATAVSGEPVLVWCYQLPNTGNGWSTRQIWLPAEQCARLEMLASGFRPRARAKLDFANAVGELVMITYRSLELEARTAVCRAVQQVERAAKELGVQPGYARDLADLYWVVGYWQTGLWSDHCRPDGLLDFHIARWPSDIGGKGPPIGKG